MVVCFIALPVLIVLGIFSASYRKLAWEAFECVFRMATFRKCKSNFDQRVKAKIVGKLMKRTPKVAGFVFKKFVVLSWIFVILFVLSLVGSGYGLYNYYLYGNCNGPDSSAFCIFDPFQEKVEDHATCGIEPIENKDLVAPKELEGLPRVGKSEVKVVMFGCFTCPYTKEATGIVEKIIKEYGTKIEFIFVAFPLDQHEMSYEASLAAECVYEADKIKYWGYIMDLLEHQEELSEENLVNYANEIGLDIEECLESREFEDEVERKIELGREAGIYGTPTFFVNGEAIVGPQEKEVFKAIDGALE
ncbi:DsbA family protein [Candidatus Woesearchaeota archaeon]|nr:DsbA family protein [Candidatus Woesearchaeota archaeon]